MNAFATSQDLYRSHLSIFFLNIVNSSITSNALITRRGYQGPGLVASICNFGGYSLSQFRNNISLVKGSGFR